jgi:hypothetical protein
MMKCFLLHPFEGRERSKVSTAQITQGITLGKVKIVSSKPETNGRKFDLRYLHDYPSIMRLFESMLMQLLICTRVGSS